MSSVLDISHSENMSHHAFPLMVADGKVTSILDDETMAMVPEQYKEMARNGEWIIAGYASTVLADRETQFAEGGDIVLPSAFKDSVGIYMSNPILRENHETGATVGRVLHTELDEKGVFVVAMVSKKTNRSREVWGLIEDECLRSFSIILLPDHETTYVKEIGGKDRRVIEKAELFEVAIVDIPANRLSQFRVVKNFKTMGKLLGTTPKEIAKVITSITADKQPPVIIMVEEETTTTEAAKEETLEDIAPPDEGTVEKEKAAKPPKTEDVEPATEEEPETEPKSLTEAEEKALPAEIRTVLQKLLESNVQVVELLKNMNDEMKSLTATTKALAPPPMEEGVPAEGAPAEEEAPPAEEEPKSADAMVELANKLNEALVRLEGIGTVEEVKPTAEADTKSETEDEADPAKQAIIKAATIAPHNEDLPATEGRGKYFPRSKSRLVKTLEKSFPE